MDIGYFVSNKPGNRGTLLLFTLSILTIAVSIIIQIYFIDNIDIKSWNDGCPTGEYRTICRQTTSVLRFSVSLVVFLSIELLFTFIHALYYDLFIIYKVLLYGAIVIGFVFSSSTSMLDYAWFARFAAFIFLVYQQIILIDFAYNWNANWVDKSEKSTNNSWLYALIISSSLLFATSIAAIGVMFWQFYGCAENDAVLIITVVLCVLATAVQVFISEDGSLLVSSFVVAYSTYLCFAAVSLNPSTECNPTLSTSYQNVSQGIGIAITVVSLIYTVYSSVEAAPAVVAESGQETKIKQMLGGEDPAEDTGIDKSSEQNNSTGRLNPEDYRGASIRKIFLLVIAIFLTMAAYYAMVLTNWATLQSGAVQSNPKTGMVAMWLQATGQWIVLMLYIWTLLAPRMFPGRDFGSAV